MATDLFLLLVFHKEFGFSHFLIFHHILIIATYSLGLLTQPMAGVYFMCAFQVQEITSIFLANRWFLLECEMKESDFYWWNGLFLIISYALIRVLFGSFVLFRLVMNLPEETLQRLDYTVIVFCSVAFQLLQFYFFYKILEVVFKFLGTKKPKKVD